MWKYIKEGKAPMWPVWALGAFAFLFSVLQPIGGTLEAIALVFFWLAIAYFVIFLGAYWAGQAFSWIIKRIQS